jgi:hypothetical protein
MPIGTVTKRFDNEKNIRVEFDNERARTYSTNKRALYDALQLGNTVEYETEQSGQYVNIVSARAVARNRTASSNGSKGTQQPAAYANTDRDTLIVDQVLFKGAIDLQTACIRTDLDAETLFHDPASAAKDAIETWERIRARHLRPEDIKQAVAEYGGVVVDEEVVPDRASDMPAPDEDYQDDLG